MSDKSIINKSTENRINQLQVAFMSKPEHKQHNTLRYQIVNSMYTDFYWRNPCFYQKVIIEGKL